MKKKTEITIDGITYRIGRYYQILIGDRFGDVERLDEIQDYGPKSINRFFICGINADSAKEYLKEVKNFKPCPCPHGKCDKPFEVRPKKRK